MEYDVYELPIQVNQHTTESDIDYQLTMSYTQIPTKKSKKSKKTKEVTNTIEDACEINSDIE